MKRTLVRRKSKSPSWPGGLCIWPNTWNYTKKISPPGEAFWKWSENARVCSSISPASTMHVMPLSSPNWDFANKPHIQRWISVDWDALGSKKTGGGQRLSILWFPLAQGGTMACRRYGREGAELPLSMRCWNTLSHNPDCEFKQLAFVLVWPFRCWFCLGDTNSVLSPIRFCQFAT